MRKVGLELKPSAEHSCRNGCSQRRKRIGRTSITAFPAVVPASAVVPAIVVTHVTKSRERPQRPDVRLLWWLERGSFVDGAADGINQSRQDPASTSCQSQLRSPSAATAMCTSDLYNQGGAAGCSCTVDTVSLVIIHTCVLV